MLVTGVPVPVLVPLDVVALLPPVVDPEPAVEVVVTAAVAEVVVVVVDVVATFWGVNGLRLEPVSFELPGVVCTAIAGSAVPEE